MNQNLVNFSYYEIQLQQDVIEALKTRKTSNHNVVVHCNIPECNSMDKTEQLRKLYGYDFDYNQFMGQSAATSVLYNKKMIYFYVIILLIWNTF